MGFPIMESSWSLCISLSFDSLHRSLYALSAFPEFPWLTPALSTPILYILLVPSSVPGIGDCPQGSSCIELCLQRELGGSSPGFYQVSSPSSVPLRELGGSSSSSVPMWEFGGSSSSVLGIGGILPSGNSSSSVPMCEFIRHTVRRSGGDDPFQAALQKNCLL